MKALFETSLGPPARGDAPSDAVIFISMSSLYLTCSNYMTLRRGAGYFVFSYLSGVRLEPVDSLLVGRFPRWLRVRLMRDSIFFCK